MYLCEKHVYARFMRLEIVRLLGTFPLFLQTVKHSNFMGLRICANFCVYLNSENKNV